MTNIEQRGAAPVSVVLFGSIGVFCETSELQRRSYNNAFRQYGLDWHWSADQYKSLLQHTGGQNRITAYVHQVGPSMDEARIEQIHALKSQLFQTHLAKSKCAPRTCCDGFGYKNLF